MSNWKCACGHDDLSHSPDLDICGMVGCSCKAFTDQRDAEIAALKLQVQSFRETVVNVNAVLTKTIEAKAVLELQVAELKAALKGLLCEDPHDLTDSRPCDTCLAAHAVYNRANGMAPHDPGCHCIPCLRAPRVTEKKEGDK